MSRYSTTSTRKKLTTDSVITLISAVAVPPRRKNISVNGQNWNRASDTAMTAPNITDRLTFFLYFIFPSFKGLVKEQILIIVRNQSFNLKDNFSTIDI